MDSPKYLYRFFSKKEYRDQFLEGHIRFLYINDYQKIESSERRDPHEGKGVRGKYKADIQTVVINKNTMKAIHEGFKHGDMNISGTSLNTYFICSFCDENVDQDKISQKFGKYGIKIENAEEFIERLNKNCSFDWKVGKIRLAKVHYDKEDYIPMNMDRTIPYEYFSTQKSKEFSDEFEWRAVLTGGLIREVEPEPKFISIGRFTDIASTLDF